MYQAIGAAAKALHEEREAWLNPPDLIALGADERTLNDRTLTNLYNALLDYRGIEAVSDQQHRSHEAALKFAPRLAQLHDALDHAVLYTSGWERVAHVRRRRRAVAALACA
jgi:hypothetical protein